MRNRFIWAVKLIPDLLLSFVYSLPLSCNFSCELLPNHTEILHLRVYSPSYFQTFPLVILLIFWNRTYSLPCAVHYYIWATVCFIEISRRFVIIPSSPPPFPSSLSCHSSLLFLSLLLLPQLSDDNAWLEEQLLHNSSMRLSTTSSWPNVRINEEICALHAGLPTGSFVQLGNIRCHHGKGDPGWPPRLPLASCCSRGRNTPGRWHNKARCWRSLSVFQEGPLFLTLKLPFFLPLVHSCSGGQSCRSLCTRSRWSDTVSTVVLCFAKLPSSFPFLSSGWASQCSRHLLRWGPEATKLSWKVSCQFSTHSLGVTAYFGAGWRG